MEDKEIVVYTMEEMKKKLDSEEYRIANILFSKELNNLNNRINKTIEKFNKKFHTKPILNIIEDKVSIGAYVDIDFIIEMYTKKQ